MKAQKARKPSKAELEAHLRELEREYELARMGLARGFITALAGMLGVVVTTLAALVPVLVLSREWISGLHLVAIIGILATALVIYFAFVFGRAARIQAEISQTKKRLDVEVGRKVR